MILLKLEGRAAAVRLRAPKQDLHWRLHKTQTSACSVETDTPENARASLRRHNVFRSVRGDTLGLGI